MAGFIGGSSAKTDRNRQLGGWNAEWNVFNTGFPLSKDLTTQAGTTTSAGLNSLDQAKAYFQKILSGGPNAVSAVAPEVNQINTAADAQRLQEAQLGTSRGGGTNAQAQNAETQRMQAVDNALMTARTPAAGEVAKIGETEAGIGSRQLAAALQALGIDEQTAANIVASSTQSRSQSFEMNPLNAVPGVLLDAALGALGL